MVDDCVVLTINDMMNELCLEARYCDNDVDVLYCLAKRDALGELLCRLSEKKLNPHWARARPELKVVGWVN